MLSACCAQSDPVPAAYSNELWMGMSGADVIVYVPEGFTNQVEVYSSNNLGSNVWKIEAQNLVPTAGARSLTWNSASSTGVFFRVGNMDIDSDADGLPDARERIVYKTLPDNPDSDGDLINDGAEIEGGMDPLDEDTDNDGLPDGWEVTNLLNPLLADGNEDPDGDLFISSHEYLLGTDPQSSFSAVELLIFDEEPEAITGSSDAVVVSDAALAYQGNNSIQFSLKNEWHYYPAIDFEAVSFGNADALEFYIRSASGTYNDILRLRVYQFSPDQMSFPVDIRPYLCDLNGQLSAGITEEYKQVVIPWVDLLQGGSNEVGAIRHMRLEVLNSEIGDVSFPQNFYVDCISLQDRIGISCEQIEVLSHTVLEVTCSDQLDPISLKDLSNHAVFKADDGTPVEVSDIGLRSWVEGFNGSADSPIVKYYVYVELAEGLTPGQAYVYSNHVQDVSGNYPDNSTIAFIYSETDVSSSIKVNQVGWLPEATKIAYVGNYLGDLGAMPLDTNVSHTAYVQDVQTGLNVYTSQLTRSENPDHFGNPDMPFSGEEVWRADFSSLRTPGEYRIFVPGIGCSYDFEIADDVYVDTFTDCMRSLWYQRSGLAMTNPATCGQWTRIGDAHQNTNTAYYHNSIADLSPLLYADEPIGEFSDFSGGWYDAADYNKYTKSAADAVNLLLTMYETVPDRFADNQLNIPESGNGIPDVLDEAKWELDWICKMVSANGAAFNKVSYPHWSDDMPSEQTGKVWVTLKTTRDTAAACAILAKAARIYKSVDPAAAALYSSKAALAWQCLTNFPDSYPLPPDSNLDVYHNPIGSGEIPDINTGNYFSTNDTTYRVWAAIEMYRLTQSPEIHNEFSNIIYRVKGNRTLKDTLGDIIYDKAGYSGATQGYVMLYDYATLTNGLPVFEDIRSIIADEIVAQIDGCWLETDLPYDFEVKSYSSLKWGEGAEIRRPYGYILAYELTGDSDWLERARINLDWSLGANPLSTTYITGIGDKYPMHPHNKFDHGDGIDEPIPGYNIYGLAEDIVDRDYYSQILDHSCPVYRDDWAAPGEPVYPVARKYVDTWESVLHGEFVIDDLARTAMVFAYFSTANSP
ncbi:MAG: glycoside hydrolase family 9 protein [Kiritimatiellales bacterium]|nr:glycoside hydrolase family 9 protein [Kiritimatiellota bacterium]MBL7016851.1 glycoside hydrolase family 9 protein [Kiritimatiellales bacterium]